MAAVGVSFRVALAVLAASALASAQPADRAAAEALFLEARKLAGDGKYAEACPKFAESQRLDPATGTLLNLADCNEHAGRTASAWMTWLEAAAAAKARGQVERERLARQRSAALQAKLSYLTIEVPGGSAVAGLSVTRNGEPVREALWGTAVPVDPERYTVVASAPGYRSWQQTVVVTPGQAPIRIQVPRLEPEPAAGDLRAVTAPPPAAAPPPPAPVAAPLPPPAAPPQPPPVAPAPASPAADQATDGSAQRTWGWVSGGVGLVGIGVGSYFGLRTFSKNKDSEDHCDEANWCDQEGVDLRDDALKSGNISTIAFGVGAAGLVAGIVLLATAPSGPEPATAPQPYARLSAGVVLGPSGGHLTLAGGF